MRRRTPKACRHLAGTFAALALLTIVGGCGKSEQLDVDEGDFEENPTEFSAIPDAKPFYGPVPFTSQFSVDIKKAKGKVKILWDFNDGSPRTTEKDPKHTFEKAGQYTVGVQVTDIDGEIEGGSLIVRAMTVAEWEDLQAKRRAAGIMADY